VYVLFEFKEIAACEEVTFSIHIIEPGIVLAIGKNNSAKHLTDSGWPSEVTNLNHKRN
jgi:hypothetical protein